MDGNEKTKETFVASREAAKITSLHPNTLRKYADRNLIKHFKTISGLRRYCKEDLYQFIGTIQPGNQEPKSTRRINFVYSRVSTRKQLDDLHRQVEFLKQFTQNGSSYEFIEDIGSGINFKRKGLQNILDSCLQGTIGEVIIAHKDRLCRFGFELIEQLITKAGGTIRIVGSQSNKSSEQELSEDLLSIVHIYSCKQMGRRKYKTTTNESNYNAVENEHGTAQNIE